MDRWQNLVFTICYRMVGSYFEAQDLTQETFLAAWKGLERFDGANEKAWICRIAANKCTDYLRRSRPPLMEDGEEALPLLADPAPDPERAALAEELRAELEEACLSLKEPYRSTAVAYFLEERTVQEIARDTGQNSKTVQTRVSRARDKLRAKLGKERVTWTIWNT